MAIKGLGLYRASDIQTWLSTPRSSSAISKSAKIKGSIVAKTVVVGMMPQLWRRCLSNVKNKSFLGKKKDRKFVDWKKVLVRGGNGGCGCMSFRREANLRFGGPDGGNGGNGGAVIVTASSAVKSLTHVHHHYSGGHGGSGDGSKRQGHTGETVVIKVPLGTEVKDTITGEVLSDLYSDGSLVTVAEGGKGGKGNTSFTSSTHQRPMETTPGEEGRVRTLTLEMKILADIGLVGFPNAGKSTLLRSLSRATPAVAAYPFTTLNPHIGMVMYDDGTQIAVADIPGLISGAHRNVGLGHAFLRHIERCTGLLYIVDLEKSETAALDQIKCLRHELNMYKTELGNKPAGVVANKIDVSNTDVIVQQLAKEISLPIIPVSGLCKWNITPLKQFIYNLCRIHKQS